MIHQSSTAQTRALQTNETAQVTPNADKSNEAEVKTDFPSQLSGVVIDAETKVGVPFASISIEGTRIGASTDFDGNFVIDVPAGMAMDEIVLVSSSLGYARLRFCPQRSSGLRVSLEAIEVEILGILIYEEQPQTKTGRLLKRTKNTLLFPFRWMRRRMVNK